MAMEYLPDKLESHYYMVGVSCYRSSINTISIRGSFLVILKSGENNRRNSLSNPRPCFPLLNTVNSHKCHGVSNHRQCGCLISNLLSQLKTKHQCSTLLALCGYQAFDMGIPVDSPQKDPVSTSDSPHKRPFYVMTSSVSSWPPSPFWPVLYGRSCRAPPHNIIKGRTSLVDITQETNTGPASYVLTFWFNDHV